MTDPRMVNLAKILVDYSVEVQPGEFVMIQTSLEAIPMAQEVLRQVQTIAERAQAEYGGFDTWVNNAAVNLYSPFEEITPPSFTMQAEWTLDQFAGFLNSWSATQRYKEQNGHHPLEKIWDELSAAWGNENDQRLVRWPLHFRIGKNTRVD